MRNKGMDSFRSACTQSIACIRAKFLSKPPELADEDEDEKKEEDEKEEDEEEEYEKEKGGVDEAVVEMSGRDSRSASEETDVATVCGSGEEMVFSQGKWRQVTFGDMEEGGCFVAGGYFKICC